MSRWECFFHNVQQDLKVYIFMLGFLCFLRAAFILLLQPYMTPNTGHELFTAMYYGLRLSSQTAGIFTLPSFFFCTIVNLIRPNLVLDRLRSGLAAGCIGIVTFIFHVRIPYFEEYHTDFHELIFKTFTDDTWALFLSLLQHHNLILRLCSVAVLSVIVYKLLKKWLNAPVFIMPSFSSQNINSIYKGAIILGIIILFFFSLQGGTLIYANSVNFENYRKVNNYLLNEAILDDIQALWRAYNVHYCEKNDVKFAVTASKLAVSLGNSKNQERSLLLDDYLLHEAEGAKIEKPKHIFIIISESYSGWPLLSKYENLHIADGIKNITKKKNASYVAAFLPASISTWNAVCCLVAGVFETTENDIRTSYYRETYATAMAPQFKKLGYKTYFWYGGPSSWDNIKEFTYVQGFDQTFSCEDFYFQRGNMWGAEDKYLFNAVSSNIHDNEENLHVILNTSNHTPYSVNLAEEGFDESQIGVNGLVEKKIDSELMEELGHFWYADKVMSEFIESTYTRYPDSLFIITGDHARKYITQNPSLFELNAVPLIIYGKGIRKNLLAPETAGGHINIIPTLIELIAPKGFRYYSVANSLTTENRVGNNLDFWITSNCMGSLKNQTIQDWFGNSKNTIDFAIEPTANLIDKERAISDWRIKKGKYINP